MPQIMIDHRAALANARRLYLHWATPGSIGSGNAAQIRSDFARIIASLERACDEIDRLRETAAPTTKSLPRENFRTTWIYPQGNVPHD